VRDEHGNVVRWYGINIDRSSIGRNIADAICQSIVVLAPDGTTLYANRVALEQTGLTIQEMNEEGFSTRAIHPDDEDRFRAERHEGLLRGAPFEYEMRLRKGGQYRWHLLQYNPLKDEQGQIIRWYATATDIDDLKRTEEKLRQSEREARQLLDLSPIHISEIGPDGIPHYNNQAALEYHGITLTVSPMDRNGYFTFGTNNDYTSTAARTAKRLIVEVNRHMPRVYGRSWPSLMSTFHLDEGIQLLAHDRQIRALRDLNSCSA
jgi:PAS domain S-box-containing protein